MKILFLNPDRNTELLVQNLRKEAEVLHLLGSKKSADFNELGLHESDTVFIADDDSHYAELIESLQLKNHYDYIFPSHHDSIGSVLGKVNDKFGLPGLSEATANMIDRKHKYYEIFGLLNIPYPKTYCYHSIDKNLTFPCIIKPSDGTGNRDVMIVYNSKELLTALRSKNKEYYLIQEYIEGQLYSVAGHVLDDNIQIDFTYDIEPGRSPYPVELGFIFPSRLSDQMTTKLTAYLQQFFEHIGLRNSLFCLDMIVVDDEMYLIDFSVRLSRNSMKPIHYMGEESYAWKLARKLVTGESFAIDAKHMVLRRNFPVDSTLKDNILGIVAELSPAYNSVVHPKDDLEAAGMGYAIVVGSDREELERKFQSLLK